MNCIPFIKTFLPEEAVPSGIILPHQVHGSRIVEIVTGHENLESCDGIWTSDYHFMLGIQTADCAPIAAWDDARFGIFHVGWRGLVNGMCENILKNFPEKSSHFFIGPILPVFEIQRDFCFSEISKKFGERFFTFENEKIFFHFQDALFSFFPHAECDERSTEDTANLASWRRDHNERRNITIIRFNE